MRVDLTMHMMEGLAEPFILLDGSGHVIDFNHAAAPWVGGCVAQVQELASAIRGARSGELALPLRIYFPLRSGLKSNQEEVFLCDADAPNFALVVVSHRAFPHVEPSLGSEDRLASLIGEETRHELSSLRVLLAKLIEGQGGTLPDIDVHSERLSRLLVALDQVARLRQTNAFMDGDRLEIHRLLKDVIAALPVLRCGFSLKPARAEDGQGLGVVYGDRSWLMTALQNLLTWVGEQAPPHSKVEVDVRQNGRFVTVQSHFASGSAPHARPSIIRLTEKSEGLELDADIRLEICRQIVDLHGGHLTLIDRDSGAVAFKPEHCDYFALVLPTGAPMKGRIPEACGKCLTSQQSSVLARELAELLPGKTPSADISDDEMRMMGDLFDLDLSSRTDLGKQA